MSVQSSVVVPTNERPPLSLPPKVSCSSSSSSDEESEPPPPIEKPTSLSLYDDAAETAARKSVESDSEPEEPKQPEPIELAPELPRRPEPTRQKSLSPSPDDKHHIDAELEPPPVTVRKDSFDRVEKLREEMKSVGRSQSADPKLIRLVTITFRVF